jgi:hypothetical protein
MYFQVFPYYFDFSGDALPVSKISTAAVEPRVPLDPVIIVLSSGWSCICKKALLGYFFTVLMNDLATSALPVFCIFLMSQFLLLLDISYRQKQESVHVRKKTPSLPKATSTKNMPKFTSLHRQWWCPN